MSARVVKVGGSVLSDPAWLASFAEHVEEADGPLVIVHGGGPEINGLAERLGVSRFMKDSTALWGDERRRVMAAIVRESRRDDNSRNTRAAAKFRCSGICKRRPKQVPNIIAIWTSAASSLETGVG